MAIERQDIVRTVAEMPSLNIQELANRFNISRTAAKYHVRRLTKTGELAVVRHGRHTLVFLQSVPPVQRHALALLRIESVRSVAQDIREHPRYNAEQVAARLRVTPRTVRRAVRELAKADLVRLSGDRDTRIADLHPELALLLARWNVPDTRRLPDVEPVSTARAWLWAIPEFVRGLVVPY